MDVPDQLASLDLAVALSRVGGDEELLKEIAEIFLDQCPEALSEIQTAAEADDAGALERAAHSLKGSIGNFGADRAYNAALRLEMMGRNRDLGGKTQAVQDLEAALKQLNPELSSLASA
ncbi:MAG: Hpt domain-containing protein [bacterium]|nr:Hpt domain-containing protein [bacterium]